MTLPQHLGPTLRQAMRRLSTVLRNLSDDHVRELDDDDRALIDKAMQDCIESLARPFVTVPIPCISYSHMHPDTSIWLQSAVEYDTDDQGGPGFIAALAEGTCFLVAPTEPRDEWPQDLQDIFAFADKHATHGWIMLDVSGDVQPDLEVY